MRPWVTGMGTIVLPAIVPIPVTHGRTNVLGFRFGPLAYVTDAKMTAPNRSRLLQGVDTLVINALRERPHPTHLSFAGRALELIEQIAPRRAYLVHLSHETGPVGRVGPAARGRRSHLRRSRGSSTEPFIPMRPSSSRPKGKGPLFTLRNPTPDHRTVHSNRAVSFQLISISSHDPPRQSLVLVGWRPRKLFSDGQGFIDQRDHPNRLDRIRARCADRVSAGACPSPRR